MSPSPPAHGAVAQDLDAPEMFRGPAGLLALRSLPRVGPVSALAAAMQGATLARLLDAHRDRMEGALERAWAQLEGYRQAGVTVLTFFDERYPERLRDLSDPPPLLYVRGDDGLLSRKRLIAVVGTREPTTFGTSAASELTGALARQKWGIVSGLAKGIDTISHRAALEHRAPTIAVMGGGLDRIYPAENKALAEEILESSGALVSEQPFGEQPRPQHLIARDRLQSGLSVAVLVAQCGVKSGTMHTARFAAGQGRPVFSPVPHSRHPANEGLRVLLERPARELCTILPAWQNAKSLCARLGEGPLAHPIRREHVDEFLSDVTLAGSWWRVQREQGTLLAPAADH